MKTITSKTWLGWTVAAAVFILPLLLPAQSRAQNNPPASSPSLASAVEDYFTDWFPRVTRIQSEQPHWVTPLVTVTPRLEEEYRYDQFWQANSHGVATDNFGAGKGLELIPFQNTEIILGVPAWVAHNGHILHSTKKKKVTTDGWADETFLDQVPIAVSQRRARQLYRDRFHGFQRTDR